MQMPTGPICQSCSMPMENPEVLGTNPDGSKSEDYCHLCFQNGTFTDPDMSMEQMMDLVTGVLVTQMHMPEVQAKGMTTTTIPTLKRWQGN